MKRFELSAGTSNKFWEIAVAGAIMTTRWGRIGSTGQQKQQTFASSAVATKAHDKLVAEKTKKGYRQVGNGATAKPAAAKPATAKPARPAAAKPAVKASSVDPKRLVLKERATVGATHRVAVTDRFAIALGNNRCSASSDGKAFHRRTSPGTTYGLAIVDGAVYTCGGPFCISHDHGATWKEIRIPFAGYRFAIARDRAGTWWLGCDGGTVLTSSRPDKGWKPARFKAPGKVLAFAEIDDKLFVAGAGSGIWNGKAFKPIKGLKKTDVITRITESPAGTLIAIGDGGIAFRSTDRGASFQPVKSGVKQDLEDCAWVAGALFVVGGGGLLRRSTDDGKTFHKVDTGSRYKIWTIASWGDGAILAGDDGKLRVLAAPNDPYWKGASDDFAPPPVEVDSTFEPHAARSAEERERTYARLAAEARGAVRSTKQRAARPTDANPKLASELDEHGDEALHVYADYLVDSGDPRGELAQLQLRLDKDPKNKKLVKAATALMKARSEALLGKLAPVADLVELTWRGGFIHKARIANTFERSSMHDGPKPEVDLVQVLEWLLDEPSARFLRELVVGILTYDENDYGGVAKAIGKRYVPSLRSLFLGDFHSEETELNWSTLGNLEPMYAALPNLTSLHVRSGSMTLGSIVLPKLQHFEVTTGGLDPKAARAIAAARWPDLRTLAIQIGSPNYGGTATLKDLAPILDGATLPRLERLALANSELRDALIAPLASSKLLPQLTGLSLEMGTMGDDGAATMVRMQRAFEHLEVIDLDDNYITAEGKRLLEKTNLAIELGSQRDDGGDPSDRYCSAAE